MPELPDLPQLVRSGLSRLELPPKEREDVIAELAAHLAESCADAQAAGIPVEHSIQKTLEQVSDWNAFATEIYFARKGATMNVRTRTLWLPGLLTLTLSMGFLLILQLSGYQPRTATWPEGGYVLLIYVPWLLSLPVFGALGALLSSRAGATRKTVLLASVFPAVYQAALFFIVLPLALIFNRAVAVHFRLDAALTQLVAWLIVPVVALALGGLALLAATKRNANPEPSRAS